MKPDLNFGSSENGAGIGLVVNIALVLLLVHVAPVPLHRLVAHYLVLELQLQLQQFDLFLVLLDLVVQVPDLSLLAAAAQHGWPHREVLVDLLHVSERHVPGGQLIHFPLESLNLLDVLVLFFGQLAHVDVVEVDINVIVPDRTVLVTLLHGLVDVFLRLMHVLHHLLLLLFHVFVVLVSAFLVLHRRVFKFYV